jgi:hypothetical protein
MRLLGTVAVAAFNTVSATTSGTSPICCIASRMTAFAPARAANADLRYEHAKKSRPLTALLLAYNLFGDSFFEASCCLGGKTAGHFLRIFKHIERIYLAPPQGEHVETMVEVRRVAVE